MGEDRIEMSQRERDVLKVMSVVLKGDRSAAEAARLLQRPFLGRHQGRAEYSTRSPYSAPGAVGDQGDAANHLRRPRSGELHG